MKLGIIAIVLSVAAFSLLPAGCKPPPNPQAEAGDASADRDAELDRIRQEFLEGERQTIARHNAGVQNAVDQLLAKPDSRRAEAQALRSEAISLIDNYAVATSTERKRLEERAKELTRKIEVFYAGTVK